MKKKILFIGTGMVPDGRFNLFYEPFLSEDVECHVVSRSPEPDIPNCHSYDYTKDDGEAFRYLYDLCRTIGIDAIVTLFEDTVLLGAKLRTALGLPGQKYEQAILFRNKYAMKNRFAQSTIPTARFAKIDEMDDAELFATKVGYPVVLKPLSLCGTESVYRCNSAEEMRFYLSNMLNAYSEGVLAEEYVNGREMSCDSVVCNDEIIYSAVTNYDPTVIDTIEDKNIGLSVVLTNDMDGGERRRISTLAKSVIDAMGFENGFTHMELFRTAHGYVVGEIAARPPGARIVDLHNISQGTNVGKILCDIVLKKDTKYHYNREYSAGVYFLSSAGNGLVTNIRGYDYINTTKEIVSYSIPCIGSAVHEKANSCDNIGYILFKARSSKDIAEKIDRARSEIHVAIN